MTGIAKLKKRRIDSFTEKRILTGLIVSSEFIEQMKPIMQLAYFQSNYAKKVADWCMEFYEAYEKAPFDHIQDIYAQREEELQEDADLVKTLLIDISNRYELDTGLNVEYLVDKAIEFFKKRELEITANNMSLLLDRNDLEGAEDQIFQYNKIAKLTSNWVSPFSQESISEVFKEENRYFQLSGTLGRYMGGFDRGWFVAIAAGFKVGKSWFLQEIAIEAMLQKKKVAFISLEMHGKDMNARIYKRLLGSGEQEGGLQQYPVFDCLRNQEDTCDLAERTCRIKLVDEDGKKPEFDPNSSYIPCTFCRNNPAFQNEYVVDHWFEMIKRPRFSERDVEKHLQSLEKIYRNCFRFKSYPRFSANISDIKRDLDILERTEMYVPDIICIDYADILKPEGKTSNETSQLDDTWKILSGMAGERHAVIFSASQVNRGGLNKKQSEQQDLALWIGKLAHVDAMYNMNQTRDEKLSGIMRIGTLLKRHEEFDPGRECTILQNLKHGQFCLDGYY